MSEPETNPDDPYTPPEAYAPKPAKEKAMGFWDHLEELRGTIVKSVITFIVFAALVGYFITEFNDVLMWPLLKVQSEFPSMPVQLGAQTIMEPFTMIIQLVMFGGLTLAAPFILFYVGQFVSPALTEKETKIILPMCLAALLLFVIGAVFSFSFLVPSTLRVSVQIIDSFHFANRWTVSSYYGLVTWLVVGVGGAFEFPLVIVLLVWMGIMTTAFLRKYRRHAIVVIFIMAAIITPTPDPITQSFFAAPLYLLYELAIFVASGIEKRRAAALAAP